MCDWSETWVTGGDHGIMYRGERLVTELLVRRSGTNEITACMLMDYWTTWTGTKVEEQHITMRKHFLVRFHIRDGKCRRVSVRVTGNDWLEQIDWFTLSVSTGRWQCHPVLSPQLHSEKRCSYAPLLLLQPNQRGYHKAPTDMGQGVGYMVQRSGIPRTTWSEQIFQGQHRLFCRCAEFTACGNGTQWSLILQELNLARWGSTNVADLLAWRTKLL